MARSGKRMTSAKEDEARFVETAGRFMGEVRRRMERRGVSGAELARRMGISRAAVNRILKPGANPTLRTMVALAAALDGDIEIVFRRPRSLTGLVPRLKPEAVTTRRRTGD